MGKFIDSDAEFSRAWTIDNQDEQEHQAEGKRDTGDHQDVSPARV
jgi:hypothetical protein